VSGTQSISGTVSDTLTDGINLTGTRDGQDIDGGAGRNPAGDAYDLRSPENSNTAADTSSFNDQDGAVGGPSIALADLATLTEFHITPLQPCPYLPGQIERKIWSELNAATVAGFGSLSRGGFRRSHGIAYRPACPRCTACIPVRVDARNFQWTKSMRRIERANLDLAGCAQPASATAEQFDLFRRYLEHRHDDGEMAGMTFLEFRWMVEDSPVPTELVEFRDQDGVLRAGCLIDQLDDGISAVYSFFDPQMDSRSLGSYAIIWLIRQALAMELPYVYLGYYISDSQKMAYKQRFQPLEGLVNGQWKPLIKS